MIMWGIKYFQTTNWSCPGGVKINENLYWCWYSKDYCYSKGDQVKYALMFTKLNDSFRFKESHFLDIPHSHWYEVHEIDCGDKQMTYGIKYVQSTYFGGSTKTARGYECWNEKGLLTLNDAFRVKEGYYDGEWPLTYYYVVEEETE